MKYLFITGGGGGGQTKSTIRDLGLFHLIYDMGGDCEIHNGITIQLWREENISPYNF